MFDPEKNCMVYIRKKIPWSIEERTGSRKKYIIDASASSYIWGSCGSSLVYSWLLVTAHVIIANLGSWGLHHVSRFIMSPWMHSIWLKYCPRKSLVDHCNTFHVGVVTYFTWMYMSYADEKITFRENFKKTEKNVSQKPTSWGLLRISEFVFYIFSLFETHGLLIHNVTICQAEQRDQKTMGLQEWNSVSCIARVSSANVFQY